ncbi:M24 family metallopeptidase [Wenzhouxiangella sp. XN79A]|uniref:M24 family metallopeptidase n=1 Tax=Wenzhouxiangella sp. XN79A TaxID=2724193 RepID=UPI00198246D6|nr:M24 family metallopeptidase [Wenzhouxiangella sp. XN79A]
MIAPRPLLLATLLLPLACTVSAAPAEPGRAVLDPRERPAVENAIVADRLANLLPELMAETGIDLWLVLNREYAEDPVYFTLVPQPSFAARRTTMLLFHRTDDGSVQPMTVNRYPLGEPYESKWSGGDLEEQWAALAALIAELDPERIGINTSSTWPEADGLTLGLHRKLLDALPDELEDRVVSAEALVVRWLETRTAAEQDLYAHVVGLARGVIAEGFSNRVITPGVTTTDDVAWYLRERFESLGLPIWFMPYVNVQRPGQDCAADTPFCGVEGVIQRGDVLHTDVGICYLKLCTDTQEMGYVLKLGESEVPADLVDALAEGNRWQDLLTAEFVTGRTGNEILAAAQASMQGKPWSFNVYTHPIGFVGHGPGPTIGMWDQPAAIPNTGDWPLYPNSAYAIEGNIAVALERWDGQHVQIKLEQTAIYDGERVIYAAGRQTGWHVVR